MPRPKLGITNAMIVVPCYLKASYRLLQMPRQMLAGRPDKHCDTEPTATSTEEVVAAPADCSCTAAVRSPPSRCQASCTLPGQHRTSLRTWRLTSSPPGLPAFNCTRIEVGSIALPVALPWLCKPDAGHRSADVLGRAGVVHFCCNRRVSKIFAVA